jgi:hypothetical protein
MAGFENSAGIGVRNWYGPRKTGGVRGHIKTEGYNNEFAHDLSQVGIPFTLPLGHTKLGVYVTRVDTAFTVGTVTAYTIGGVSVLNASDTAPVFLAATNTGVLAQTGGTGGLVVVRYKNVAGA